MPQKQPMSDVIILVPGILGSVLVKNGREVWGASGSSIAGNLITFGKALGRLELPQGIGHDDPKDGVVAPRVLPRLHMIPTFWKADGYGRLAGRLKERFTLTQATDEQAGNLLEFPYDWRLSNQLNAQRLSQAVIPILERWRRATKNPTAKLIFICHSMGGLVARYFLEVLGARELTRKLITIGTPYQGSINALDALVNGLFLGFGPIGVSVDKLVRSFPSVHQLLPTYDCLDVGDGKLGDLSGADLPNVKQNDVAEAFAFHSQIANAIEQDPKYETFAIKGIDQPTSQSALLHNGKIEPIRSYKGEDKSGDGTVPRPSSHPPEWERERSSVFVSQSHAVLQSTDSILTQIFGMLTGTLGRFMGGTGIGLDIPAIVEAGNAVPVDVVSRDGNPTLALHVVCHGENGQPRGNPKPMKPLGKGLYHTVLEDLPEGAFKITVQSATPAKPLDPVSDWTLVWNAASV
jgi:Lecithin:cholesterol acyltransferase